MAITYSAGVITITSAKDSGTSTGGSATTLVDTSQSWSTDTYEGRIVWNKTDNMMGFIKSNTSNTLTVENWHYCDTSKGKVVVSGTCAASKAYLICHNFADLVADQPTYCSWSPAQPQDTCLINAELDFGISGCLADVGRNLIHTGASQYIDCNTAGTLFQMGRLNSSGYGVDGGVYIQTLDPSADSSYPEPDMFGLWCMYGGHYEVNKDVDDDYNSNIRYNRDDFNSTDGFWWVDSTGTRAQVCVQNSYFILRSEFLKFNMNLYEPAALLKDIIVHEAMLAPRAESTVAQWNGGDTFDATVTGDVESGVATQPIFMYNTEEDESIAYFWNFSAPEYARNNNIQWYNAGAVVEVYFGSTVDIQVNDSNGDPINSVTLGLFDDDGNEGWTIGKGNAAADYAPVKSYWISTNTDGTYVGPFGSNEGAFTVLYRLQRSSTGYVGIASNIVEYDPYTLRIRKYGYLEQFYSRDYSGRSTESFTLLTDQNVSADEATAANYASGISINLSTKLITLTGNYNMQQIYDYHQYIAASGNNMQYDTILTAVSPGVYDIDDGRIKIDDGGTLTLTKDLGVLYSDDPGWDDSTYLHAIDVLDGGTLIVGEPLSEDICFWNNGYRANSWMTQNQVIRVQSGGAFYWKGGLIHFYGMSMQIEEGCSGYVSSTAILYATHPDTDNRAAIRLQESDFAVYSMEGNAGVPVWFVVPTIPYKGMVFKNQAKHCFVGLDNDGVNGIWIDLEDFDVQDDTINYGYAFWDKRWARFINLADGTDFGIRGNLDDNSNNKGLAEVRQEITFTCTSGSNAKFYTVDTNNGSRLSASQICDNPNYNTDRSYELTESNGEATYDTDGGVLTGVAWRSTGGTYNTNNNFDRRSINDSTDDIFNWLKVEYGYQPGTLEVAMRGAGGTTSAINLLPDLGITEPSSSVVASYSGIRCDYNAGTLTATVSANRTWDEIYDYIKYYESQNPADVWENDKESFITTSDKISYSPHNFELHVESTSTVTADGDNVTTNGFWISGQFTGLINDGTNYRVPITVTNLVSGSRLYIARDSDTYQIYNDIVPDTSNTTYYTQSSNTDVTLRVRNASNTNKYKPYEIGGTITNAAGLSVQVSLIEDQ